jgi:RNA polymerase sigma-70 factor (ECF subfamily)
MRPDGRQRPREMEPGRPVDEALKRDMLELLPRLRRFACGLTGTVDEGDDLVQATYERAIRYADSWQPGTRLDSWMFRIARNLHLNELRRRRVRREHLRVVAAEDEEDKRETGAAEAKLTLDAVTGFLGRLPEEQRSVLLLICVEGLSYKETAAALDLPIGTVTSRLARARIALAGFVEGTGADAGAAQKNAAQKKGMAR